MSREKCCVYTNTKRRGTLESLCIKGVLFQVSICLGTYQSRVRQRLVEKKTMERGRRRTWDRTGFP